jgi:hypothetical protein
MAGSRCRKPNKTIPKGKNQKKPQSKRAKDKQLNTPIIVKMFRPVERPLAFYVFSELSKEDSDKMRIEKFDDYKEEVKEYLKELYKAKKRYKQENNSGMLEYVNKEIAKSKLAIAQDRPGLNFLE